MAAFPLHLALTVTHAIHFYILHIIAQSFHLPSRMQYVLRVYEYFTFVGSCVTSGPNICLLGRIRAPL